MLSHTTKRIFVLIFSLGLFSLFTGCTDDSNITESDPDPVTEDSTDAVPSDAEWQMVWNDEFDYEGTPDPEKWNFETGANGWGNNELQYYTDRLENAEVRDNMLVITAREEDFQGSNYTSARMITYDGGHHWAYGRIEARMQLPEGKGIWPAFWMLGKNIFEGTTWPATGEIDIMEMIGGDENERIVHGTAHWDNNGEHALYGNSLTHSEKLSRNFHTYAIEWDEQYIRWFFDGEQFNEIDIQPAGLSEFNKPFFILLNIAVGGNWPGSPDGTTQFPQTMKVDYVRVYQK
jgi:beta-glucanase (GH16 family)